MREYLLVLMVAAVITYAATPFMRAVAVRTSAFTPVRDRDVHSTPIPRLGGVAIYLGFAASMIAASHLPLLGQVFQLRARAPGRAHRAPASSACSGRSTTSASWTG